MLKRLLVTLSAIALINATEPIPASDTIRVTLSSTKTLDAAHVFLGVAVLGHNVGRIESGWIVKQKGEGMLHIDWSRSGDWTGLTRTEEGPRDTSVAQLNAVISVIEKKMGYPASAIRAWRVAAPVGYDGFDEGDRVLTIGEILVDLGTPEQAHGAFERWWLTIAGKNDPFDAVPRTNVRYVGWLYIQPDCSATNAELKTEQTVRAQVVASTLATFANRSAAFASYASTPEAQVLCPADSKPNFTNTYGPPTYFRDSDLSAPFWGSLSFSLSKNQRTPSASRYIATFGSASIVAKADTTIVYSEHYLGSKAGPAYATERAELDRGIASAQTATDPRNFLVVRRSENQLDYVDVFVRVGANDQAKVAALKDMLFFGRFQESFTARPIVSDCRSLRQAALKTALAMSRKKAEIAAHLLHTTVTAMSGATLNADFGGSVICDVSPTADMPTLARARTNMTFGWGLAHDSAVDATIDARWEIGPGPAAASLRPTEYTANVHGARSEDEASLTAFAQAMREAVVDNPDITSLYESEPSTNSYSGTPSASETVTVLRTHSP